MILKKIRMRNFRQFRGDQEVEFSHGSEGNVTVIFGENGRGKTGIYRALLFCLYGSKQLSHDAHIDSRELYLVNYPEMEERQNSRKSVKASVCLEFGHRNKEYQIERSILGMLDDGEVIQEDNGVRLTVRDEDGNSNTISDPNEIERSICSILDKGLKEYFLFDGEKIEKLTRATSRQRSEISRGIRKLLDIDILESAKKATDRLRKYLDSEIANRATGLYARVLHQLSENDNLSHKLQVDCENIERELELAYQEKKSADDKLSKIQEISDLLKERSIEEDRKKTLEQEIDDLLREMKNHTNKTSTLLIRKTIENVFNYIDGCKQKHELPSEIRQELIDRLLEEGLCICGSKLEAGTDEYHKVLTWRNRATDTVTEDSMLNLWRLLSKDANRYEDIGTNTMSVLQKYALARDNINKVERTIVSLSDQIGSSPRSDASKLEKYRRSIEKKIYVLEADQNKKQEELLIQAEEKEELQQKRKECEKEQGILNELSKRSILATETHQAFCNIYEEFTGEARDMIGSNATKYFQELLDEEGKKTLSDIVVNPDYSIQVYDRWHKPFLANISAGQRQIMSIAFIASLAKAATGSSVLEMPWFMDTPFGRLSREHRRNMLEKVPGWCTQWILLATDTEFGRYESEILENTGDWAKFYVLKGTGAGSTSIESLNVQQARLMLRDEAGE